MKEKLRFSHLSGRLSMVPFSKGEARLAKTASTANYVNHADGLDGRSISEGPDGEVEFDWQES